jgi:hypothetical protein
VRRARKNGDANRLIGSRAAKGDTEPSPLVRIRITSLPDAHQFDEYDVRRYRVGEIYEFPVRLATLLILAGCAEELGDEVFPLTEAADFTRRSRLDRRKR